MNAREVGNKARCTLCDWDLWALVVVGTSAATLDLATWKRQKVVLTSSFCIRLLQDGEFDFSTFPLSLQLALAAVQSSVSAQGKPCR